MSCASVLEFPSRPALSALQDLQERDLFRLWVSVEQQELAYEIAATMPRWEYSAIHGRDRSDTWLLDQRVGQIGQLGSCLCAFGAATGRSLYEAHHEAVAKAVAKALAEGTKPVGDGGVDLPGLKTDTKSSLVYNPYYGRYPLRGDFDLPCVKTVFKQDWRYLRVLVLGTPEEILARPSAPRELIVVGWATSAMLFGRVKDKLADAWSIPLRELLPLRRFPRPVGSGLFPHLPVSP